MNRIIDTIFVYMYTWHYQRKSLDLSMESNLSMDPTEIASWSLGMGVGVWLILVNLICSVIFKYYFLSVYCVVIISILSLVSGNLFNNYYLNKNRAINLYNKYQSSPDRRSPGKGILIAILILLIPAFLIMILTMILWL